MSSYSRADSTRQSVTVQVICSSLKITNYLLNLNCSVLNMGKLGSTLRACTLPIVVWYGSFSGKELPLISYIGIERLNYSISYLIAWYC